jgi:Resolvase, N terminal domain
MVLAGTPGTGSGAGGGADVLAAWAASLVSRREGMPGRGYLRFVFYGRVSTEDWQDPVTSRARQLQQAALLVAGQGTIVAEFFDSGQSRTLAWPRRPQAAALVAALADPDRGSDAVVIGEYERAFYGSQYASMAPLFEYYGIGLWMPEVGGRVDWHAEDHEQTMLALGLSSKRESPGPGSGSGPRWPCRPVSRAGIWVAGTLAPSSHYHPLEPLTRYGAHGLKHPCRGGIAVLRL